MYKSELSDLVPKPSNQTRPVTDPNQANCLGKQARYPAFKLQLERFAAKWIPVRVEENASKQKE
jgi:hypothetical protein